RGAPCAGPPPARPGPPAVTAMGTPANYLRETALMVNRLLITAGAVAAAAGVIFALQGFGVLGGSVMSGSSLWAALGPVIAVAGLVAGAAGIRPLRRVSDRRPCVLWAVGR